MAIYGVTTARLLGPEGKGVVTAVFTWSQLLAWGSVAGLSTAIGVSVASKGEAASQDDAVRKALANAVVFTALVGGLITACASILLPATLAHLGADARSLTILSLVTVPIQMLAILTLMIQLALGRTRTYALAQIVNPITMVALGAFFLLTSSTLTPSDVVLSAIAGGIASLVASARHLPWRSMRVHLASLRRDLAFGGKVHLGSLLRLTNLRFDYLVMSAFLPAVQVGLYSAANSAMIPISTVPVIAATLLSPAVARLTDSADAETSRRLQIALIRGKAKRYTLSALLGAGLICVTASGIVPVVLGKSFGGSVRLIWILAPGYVALCFNNIIAAGTAGMKRPWVGTFAEGTAVAVTLILLPILLPPLGADGAAIASTAAYACSALVAGVGFARLCRGREFTGVGGPGTRVGQGPVEEKLDGQLPSGLGAREWL
jgi:O-antigen/teichoic acid export membrane protein